MWLQSSMHRHLYVFGAVSAASSMLLFWLTVINSADEYMKTCLTGGDVALGGKQVIGR